MSDTTFNTSSRPAAISAVDSPTTHSPESVAASPSGDGSGRPAHKHEWAVVGECEMWTRYHCACGVWFECDHLGCIHPDHPHIKSAPFEVPSTRYAIEFEDRRVSEYLRSVPRGEVL